MATSSSYNSQQTSDNARWRRRGVWKTDPVADEAVRRQDARIVAEAWALLSELYGHLTCTRGSMVIACLVPQIALKAGGKDGAAVNPGSHRFQPLDGEVVEEAIVDVVTDYCGGGFDLGLVNDVYNMVSPTLFAPVWEGYEHPSYKRPGDPDVHPSRNDYVAARRRLVDAVASGLLLRGMAGPMPDHFEPLVIAPGGA